MNFMENKVKMTLGKTIGEWLIKTYVIVSVTCCTVKKKKKIARNMSFSELVSLFL